MPHETFARDGNRVPVVGGVTNDSDLFITALRLDATTKRLLVDVNGADLISDGDAVDGDTTGYVMLGTDGSNYQVLSVNSDGELKVNLETADIEIGAVEIKNSSDDTRATVGANGLYVDVQNLNPGTSATSLGKAEDAAHTSGDVGVMMLGVENEDQADLSTGDKDYTPIGVTKEGNVIVKQEGTITVTESSPISGFATEAKQLADGHNVTIDNGAAGAAVNIQDGGNTITVDGTVSSNATLQTGTAVVGKVRLVTATGDEITEDTDNSIQVTIVADDVGIGGGTAYTEDVATANPIVGTATVIERDDQLAAVTPAEGDWIGLRGTEKGALWVALADASGDPITSFGGGTEYTEDVATANPQVGKAIMVERDDALTTVTPVEGDWIGLRGTSEGALWVQDFNSDAILSDTNAMVVDLAAIEVLQTTIAGDTTSIDADTTTIIGHVDGIEGLLGTIDTDTGAMVTDLAAIEALLITIDSDTNTIQTDTTSIDADTTTIIGHVDGIEGLLGTIDTDTGAMAVDLAAIEVLLTGIDSDTNTIQGDTTAIQTAIEKIDGAVIGPGEPTIDSFTQASVNLNAGANQVLVSSAANKQIWVYGFGFTLSVAGTVSFQDEDDTAITGIMDFAANSGMSVAPSGNFAMPVWKLATNKDLEVDVVTAAIDGWISYAIVSV